MRLESQTSLKEILQNVHAIQGKMVIVRPLHAQSPSSGFSVGCEIQWSPPELFCVSHDTVHHCMDTRILSFNSIFIVMEGYLFLSLGESQF